MAQDGMTTLAAVAKARPAKLQINNSGSWKTIARFDAGDEATGEKACTAGQLLGELGGLRTTLRIATDEALPTVLMRWDARRGWWIVDADRQWER